MAGFWNTAPEVNRQYRWYINFGGTGLNNISFALKKAAKPTMKISEVTHKYLNHFFYYPGRVEWDPIQISFASVKGLEGNLTTAATLYKILQDSGYQYPGEYAKDRKTISKVGAVGQLTSADADAVGKGGASIELIQIDAEGKTLESWYLFNPFFTEVKFDSLDYSSEDILNVDATIKYDYATLGVKDGKSLLPTE